MEYKMLKSAIAQYQNNTLLLPFLRRCSHCPELDEIYGKKGKICEHLEKLGTQIYTIQKYYKGEKLKVKILRDILKSQNVEVFLDLKIYEFLCETRHQVNDAAYFCMEQKQHLHYKAPKIKKLIYYTLSFNPERDIDEMVNEVFETTESEHEIYKYECVLSKY